MFSGELTIVTNYDREEIIIMIREAFKEELAEVLKKQEKEIDYDQLLTRKEVAEMLKVTILRFENSILKVKRIGVWRIELTSF